MEMVLIKATSKEWDYISNYLINHPINKGIDNPLAALNESNGEKWKYKGSYRSGENVIHELKHNSHPSNNEEYKIMLTASDEFSDDDIGEVISIR